MPNFDVLQKQLEQYAEEMQKRGEEITLRRLETLSEHDPEGRLENDELMQQLAVRVCRLESILEMSGVLEED